jgi:hypothetical protein
MFTKIALAEAERKRRIEAEAQELVDKAQRQKLWQAWQSACEFVATGHVNQEARRWAGLIRSACDLLKSAGDARRLEALRYQGLDRPECAGTALAYEVCRLACSADHVKMTNTIRMLLEIGGKLQHSFRLYLESVRDNRPWWETGQQGSDHR